MEEMTKLLQNVQDQMQRRVRDARPAHCCCTWAIVLVLKWFYNDILCVMVQDEDAAEAHGREETSDRRLQQMQTALTQLEARCSVSFIVSAFIDAVMCNACDMF